MRILYIVLIELFVLTDLSDNKKMEPIKYYYQNSINKKSPEYKVANAVLNLGINIFQHNYVSNEKIQVISPLSIAGATALIEIGANVKTLEELMKIHGQTES